MLLDMAFHGEEKLCEQVNSAAKCLSEIVLPSCSFRDIILVGLDIGGSLAKVAYSLISRQENVGGEAEEGKICLASFDAEQFDECIEFIRSHVLAHSNGHQVLIGATGVGSHKYRERLLSHLQNNPSLRVTVDSFELQRGLQGIHFVWEHLPATRLLHPLSDQATVDTLRFQCPLTQSGVLPCLVASIGSSLIIAKVSTSGQFEALVGASTQGGLSLLGLGALLTSARSFDELIKLAKKGDRMKVDLTVKDMAGGEYNEVPESCLVSSFGQAAKKPGMQFNEADVASSLLYCVTDQMALTSYLVAQAHSIHNIVFYGSYLSGQTGIVAQIKEKIAACSYVLKHRVSPLFMQNEGHMGALGALVEQHTQHVLSSASPANQ